jgi:methionyl-tRNA formyltransferase
MKLTNIILSEKEWNKDLIFKLKDEFQNVNWLLIDAKKDFTLTNLSQYKIYSAYECIVFHMTDLPYGRGGSPLQNLIVRGHSETKISALRVVKVVDAGPIYLKKKLDLTGTAKEIFSNANEIIENMISEIISKKINPKAQEGEVVKFSRRKPEDGNIEEVEDLEKVYDYIRMLDADGYPAAFLETENLKLEFTKAHFNRDEEIITAHVRIFKK